MIRCWFDKNYPFSICRNRVLLWPRNTSTAPSHGLLSKGSPCLCTSFSGQSHHCWSIIEQPYWLDFKNRFHSAVLLIDCWKGSYIPEDEEPRSIELVQNCYVNPIWWGVWRLYNWSRVLNTYCIEKTLRLRIFGPCPLSLSTEVTSKLNFKIARKYFVKREHFLHFLNWFCLGAWKQLC